MDLSSILDPSHLLTFLGGTAVGAAGTYYADFFTDQRKKKEARVEVDAVFSKARTAMFDLIEEIRADLDRESDSHIRELVVLPSERSIFNSDRPRFAYYESQHAGLKDKFATLASYGYVECLRATDAPIFRLQEHFVERLARLSTSVN